MSASQKQEEAILACQALAGLCVEAGTTLRADLSPADLAQATAIRDWLQEHLASVGWGEDVPVCEQRCHM